MIVEIEINNCDDCDYYVYVSCLGNVCFHPEAPEIDMNDDDNEEEPLAENREGDFWIYCPYLNK